MGEYLAVHPDKECIGKLAEGFRGCKGTRSTLFHDAVGSLTLDKLVDGVGFGDVLHTPSK